MNAVKTTLASILASLLPSLLIAGGASTALAASEDNGGLPQLDFTTWPTQIFWLVIAFLLAYLLMARVVTPRISTVLEERHYRIQDDFERAETSTRDAEDMRLAFEKALADAKRDAAQKTQQTLAQAAQDAEKKNASAAKRLTAEINAAEARINAARAQALKEIDQVATTAALDAVEHLVGIKPSQAEAQKAAQKATQKTAKNIAQQEKTS